MFGKSCFQILGKLYKEPNWNLTETESQPRTTTELLLNHYLTAVLGYFWAVV